MTPMMAHALTVFVRVVGFLLLGVCVLTAVDSLVNFIIVTFGSEKPTNSKIITRD